MRQLLLPALLLITLTSIAQTAKEINIIPAPAEIKVTRKADFNLTKNTVIVLEGSGLQNIAVFFNDYLQRIYGIKLKISKNSGENNAIVFNYEQLDKPIPGGYHLSVNGNGVYIAGDNEAGVFYGLQTLIQLMPFRKAASAVFPSKLAIPQLTITDYPRFSYRGMHLDVSRHFFQPASVKKYIDYLALHKFNYFHWHLTDDQGWRIEIKKYPLLTSVGGFRNGTIVGKKPGTGNDSLTYGGFYTQAEIKDIVQYAAKRYITIIPEIEMPGHASAAIAAYPQLSCFSGESTKILATTPWAGSRQGKQLQQTWGVFEDVFCPSDYTFTFLENVLDEVIQLFPSTYIHIGGDECPKESWKRSDFCQQLIKEKGLKDEHGLQSYFIQRIEKYLKNKGKKIIGWDEILEGGIAPNATIMSWRGEDGGIAAAKENHDVIMTPNTYVYFDYSQTQNEDSLTIGGYLPLQKIYNYEPLPPALNNEEAKHILGIQANVWTEYIANDKKLEYMIFPRMSALSEVAWSPKNKRDWKDFENRLPGLFERYKMWGINYNSAYYDLRAFVVPTNNFKGVLWKLESNQKTAAIKYGAPEKNSLNFTYEKPVLIERDTMYTAFLQNKDGSSSNALHQQFLFNKATGKKAVLKYQPDEKYAGSGAFTLVNGVVTDKKLDQALEWLGFLGKDMDAVIDLGKSQSINVISLHVLKQEGSWIYPPTSVEFFISDNGTDFISQGTQKPGNDGLWPNERQIDFKPVHVSARFIKVSAKNFGIIPPGQPGGGSPAWLFVDEIGVK